MSETEIEAIAEYFTNSAVVTVQSVMLQTPEAKASVAAEKFFQARKALGIEGYISKDDGIAAINARLAKAREET